MTTVQATAARRALVTYWPGGVVDLEVDGAPATRFRPGLAGDAERRIAHLRTIGADVVEVVHEEVFPCS